MNANLTPSRAWEPIPDEAWSAAHARHFFRRAAWGATPADVKRALENGLSATVSEAFGTALSMPIPQSVNEAAETMRGLYQRVQQAPTQEKKEELRAESRRKQLAAYHDMSIRWLQFASSPQRAPYEKWTSFLQNIFVVSYGALNNPSLVFQHHELLRQKGLGTAPELCSAVSRSPAMILYLDLQQSRSSAPNENFARELFELFTLGEGNYTEEDIKEAARAFTGYRQQNGEFRFARNQHDFGKKKIFGRTGPWEGDDVIDLIFRQKAAATFLPREMCRFYLSDQELHPAYIEALGEIWRKSRYRLSTLLETFFKSRIFYDARFRGNLIKSPVHFHLGLLHDLDLTVPPFPRNIIVRYRQMGQTLYQPPSVRGWVGGRLWINASTLTARRMLVESLFQPFSPQNLNADERRTLLAFRQEGRVELVVTRRRLSQMAEADPQAISRRLTDFFLAHR
ncbi:MAG TPA: DUF1800 domain-containing protein, partial [Opitutales bacterium]|nr:DUF1800 domain-containing protein [Opitutales bacterium]